MPASIIVIVDSRLSSGRMREVAQEGALSEDRALHEGAPPDRHPRSEERSGDSAVRTDGAALPENGIRHLSARGQVNLLHEDRPRPHAGALLHAAPRTDV